MRENWLGRMAQLPGRDVDLTELSNVMPRGETAPKGLQPTLNCLNKAQQMVEGLTYRKETKYRCLYKVDRQSTPVESLAQCHSCGGWCYGSY